MRSAAYKRALQMVLMRRRARTQPSWCSASRRKWQASAGQRERIHLLVSAECPCISYEALGRWSVE